MSIRKWIRNWLLNENVTLNSRPDVVETSPENGTQISIAEAINGRVLTIRTCRPNHPQYASSWITELYVLKDGESLPDALTMLLLMKGMK